MKTKSKHYTTKDLVLGIFKLKKDDRLESTIFKKNNGIINPISYKFSREKKDSVQLIETFFDGF